MGRHRKFESGFKPKNPVEAILWTNHPTEKAVRAAYVFLEKRARFAREEEAIASLEKANDGVSERLYNSSWRELAEKLHNKVAEVLASRTEDLSRKQKTLKVRAKVGPVEGEIEKTDAYQPAAGKV